MWMDIQFEPSCGRPYLFRIWINTEAKGKHMSEIERLNRTLKKRVRVTYNEIKRNLTKIAVFIIRDMVYTAVFWVNISPDANRISTTISTQSMLTLIKLKVSCHYLLKFGD